MRPQRQRPPCVELLEDRLALSAGAADVVFGAAGQVTTGFSLGPAQGNALAVQPDGQVVVADQAGSSHKAFGLARYHLDGQASPLRVRVTLLRRPGTPACGLPGSRARALAWPCRSLLPSLYPCQDE
jgi:hypothetical protein